MVTVDQVKRGVARYLDEDIMPKLTGLQRWVIGAGSVAYLAKINEVEQLLHASPALNMLHLVDNGQVDIDLIYRSIRPQAEREPAEISLPGIGKMKLTVADVDRIYEVIMRS